MSYPNIIETHKSDVYSIYENIQEKVNLSDLINLIYPIGSIYMSVNNVSPQTFLGGTWEQIKDTFLLCSGDTYTAGSTGGEATHILSVAETPAHTHTRGTMNITGTTSGVYGNVTDAVASGAFSSNIYLDNKSYSPSGSVNEWFSMNFDASRSWTGSTSSVGSGQAHNNMPPYLAVYMWKRVS